MFSFIELVAAIVIALFIMFIVGMYISIFMIGNERVMMWFYKKIIKSTEKLIENLEDLQ